MKSQLRAEFLKQRTTRTTVGLLGSVLGIVLLAIALHAFGLPERSLATEPDQLGIFIDVGENLGLLFAALLGAMAMTGEIRHGTIRPTLLTTPQRGRVIAAKAISASVTGTLIGALATALAAGAGSLFLGMRNVTVDLGTGDYTLLILGGAVAGALWAVVGLGVGAVVRSQVPTVVGIFVWVLFFENILGATFPSVGKYAPAALARAMAGETNGTLQTPAIAAAVLGVYAAAAIAIAWLATTRRDFA